MCYEKKNEIKPQIQSNKKKKITHKREQKIDFAFKVFDRDNSKHIELDNLVEMLVATHPATRNLQDVELLVKKAKFIMKQCDSDGNGMLDKHEFKEMAQKFPNLVLPKLVKDEPNNNVHQMKSKQNM